VNGPRLKPGPRLEIRELCALCGKPMLAGHATCETVQDERNVVVHARCNEGNGVRRRADGSERRTG
jgi:RNase P subunit RPR2